MNNSSKPDRPFARLSLRPVVYNHYERGTVEIVRGTPQWWVEPWISRRGIAFGIGFEDFQSGQCAFIFKVILRRYRSRTARHADCRALIVSLLDRGLSGPISAPRRVREPGRGPPTPTRPRGALKLNSLSIPVDCPLSLLAIISIQGSGMRLT